MGSYWIGSTRAAYLRLARICLFWFLGLLRLIFSADYTYFSIFHISVDLALIQCPFATPNASRNNSNNKYNVHPQQLCLCARTKPNSWGISGFKWSHGGGNPLQFKINRCCGRGVNGTLASNRSSSHKQHLLIKSQ